MQAPKLAVYGDYKSKGPIYAIGEEFYQLFSSAGLCALLLIGNTAPVTELIVAVTGWEFSWAEGLKVGQRVLTLRQAFNAREGLTPDDFRLPQRLIGPAYVGAAEGANVDFDSLKSGYFAALGWDFKSGKPYPKTLIELGLYELASEL